MKRTLFISFFCLLLSAHFASGATAGVLSFELSPVGPNYLFGSTVSFKVLYNGVETTGTCSLATTTPGGLSSEVRNAAGCNFNAYQLLLVGVYNFSITYTDPTNGPSTLSTTATVASAPALKFSFILSQQNPPAGSSLTVSSTFVADLTTMDSAWAATHPTITGKINLLNHATGGQLQVGGAQTPIWDGAVNWTVTVPNAGMDLQFQGDGYFEAVTITDIVTVAAATAAATTTTSVTTSPVVTTSVPPTTTPMVTVTADPSIQTRLNNLDLTNITAIDIVVDLVISALSPTLSPLDTQNLIETMLLKLLGGAKLLQPASKVISSVKKFISNSKVMGGMTGKGLLVVVDVVAVLIKPLDISYGNDIAEIISWGIEGYQGIAENGTGRFVSTTVTIVGESLNRAAQELLMQGYGSASNATPAATFTVTSAAFAGISAKGGLGGGAFAAFADFPPDVAVNSSGSQFIVIKITWSPGKFPSALSPDATNVVHAGSPVITISIYTEAGDGVSVSSSLPIKFDVNVPQNGTKFPSFQELAYAIWPCGDFVLDTVSNVASYSGDGTCITPPWFSCGFYQYSGGVWLKDGCQALELTSSKITCGCTHLTDFSVLIDPNGQDAPPKKKKKNKNIPIIAGAAGGGALLLVVIVIVLAMVFKGKCTDSHSQSFGKSERIDTL